jgi:hypothetical protein
MSALRELSAVIVAAIVVGCIFAAINVAAGADRVVFLPAMTVASMIALLHAALFGVPAAWIMARTGKLNLANVLGVAFSIGALPMPVLLFATGGVSWTLGTYVIVTLSCGALGLLGGLVWWSVAGVSSNKSLERTREG